MNTIRESRATRPAAQTVMPPADFEAMLDVSKFLESISEHAALLGPDGQTVPLPEEIFHVLVDIVSAMKIGKAITVAPVDQMLTTQEAADFLGISRPTLVKLLETGRLPFERVAGGRHRRIRLDDVIRYQESKRRESRETLASMTAEAAKQELYDFGVESYADALREARRELSGGN